VLIEALPTVRAQYHDASCDGRRCNKGHRLQRHNAERLIQAGKQTTSTTLYSRKQLSSGMKPVNNVARDAQPVRQLDEVVLVATACHHQIGVWLLRAHRGQRLDQHVRALLAHRPPTKKRISPRRGKLRAESLGFLLREIELEFLFVDAVVHNVDLYPRAFWRAFSTLPFMKSEQTITSRLIRKLPLDGVDIPLISLLNAVVSSVLVAWMVATSGSLYGTSARAR